MLHKSVVVKLFYSQVPPEIHPVDSFEEQPLLPSMSVLYSFSYNPLPTALCDALLDGPYRSLNAKTTWFV
jgi:hypothetical protein